MSTDIGTYIVTFNASDKCTIVPCSYTINVISALDYYSKATGDLLQLSTWGANPDGSGPNPADFLYGKTFHLANRVPTYTITGDCTFFAMAAHTGRQSITYKWNP